MNEQPKWFLTSKTIAGILVAAAGLVLDAAGVEQIEHATNAALQVLPEIVQAVGLVVAAFGRAKAEKPLTLKP